MDIRVISTSENSFILAGKDVCDLKCICLALRSVDAICADRNTTCFL